jgi:site-specific DNA recombinase
MATEPGPTFRWGCLTRRSKYNADGTEGSTRRQELAVCDHIRANNMGQVVAVYSDIASAYAVNAKRPDFEAALDDLRAGPIDGIAVWKVDRLVRRVSQFRRVLDTLESSGGRLFSLVEGIDTADPERRFINGLILDLLVRLAEMESESTSERLVLMAQDRARQGKHHGGGSRPFGHTMDWFALLPREAEAIRDAARRILEGEGVYSIVQDWNEHGPRPVKAEQWSTQVLTSILLEPRLVAKRDYGGDLFDLEDVPQILDVETWERVCARLAEPKPHSGTSRTHRLLSGIAQCGRCLVPLRGGKNMPSRGGKHLYACPPKSRGQGSCGSLSVNSDPVDEIVSERVVKWLEDKRNVTNLLKLYSHGPEAEAMTQRVAELNDSLVDLAHALKPPPGQPKMPLKLYWQMVAEVEAEREELQRRLAVTREASLLVETLSFEDMASEWTQRPNEWRRAILKLCTKRIVVEPVGKLAGVTPKGFRFDPERVLVEFVV